MNMTRITLSVVSRLAVAAMLALPGTSGALEPHNVPLYLSTGVSPNMVITLDDSGSMAWAYVPDSISSDSSTRRFKAASYNAQYYNPKTRYLPPLDVNGTPLTTSFTAAWRNGFYPGHGSVNLETQYRPYSSFNSTGVGSTSYSQSLANHSPLDVGTSPKPFPTNKSDTQAYYYVFDSSLSGCDGSATDEDCYKLVKVSSTSGPGTQDINGDSVIDAADKDERQNFANWFSFYRTRNLATITAASRAFQDIPEEMRVAWQALNTCTSFGATACKGWDGAGVENRIRRLDAAHKTRLYKWLFKLPASGGTPLRPALQRAGQYYEIKTGTGSPYAFDPQVDDTPAKRYSCRANYSLIMTDGIWNGSGASGTLASDGASRTLPKVYAESCPAATPDCLENFDPNTYVPISPFKDSNSGSLADIAFHYWITDLNPDLKNDVPRFPRSLDNVSADILKANFWDPRNDPAKWQHMVTYTVGLGLTRVLGTTVPPLLWDGDTYSENATTSSYPGLKSGGPWPAAGTDLPGNVADLWHAAINSRGKFFSADDPETLNASLSSIVNDIAGRVSSAASIAANSKRLEASTHIYLASFDSNDWSGDLQALPLDPVTGLVGSSVWSANAVLPAHGSRSIWTSDAANVGVPFTGGFGGTLTADVVNYVRGDQSLEEKYFDPVTNPAAAFRNRSKILGDIVNSDPLFVAKDNFNLSAIPAYADSYTEFVKNKSTNGVIYVGANDGMLHAFDAKTGVEKFAFVPRAIHDSLAELTSTSYNANHKYFVDGAPGFGDAYWGASWHTVLVGTLGAGGKSVFALDITDPDSPMDAGKVLWEFDGGAHASKMGYVFGPAGVARFHDGNFYAVFANGYGSADKQAGLFLVRVDNPTDYIYIDTKYGSAAAENGLSTVKLVDLNNDRIVDAIYAGDLQGNLWKFDVSDTVAANWKTSLGSVASPKPLFVAKDAGGKRQPIQGQVSVSLPPPGVSGNAMVFFGTGRYFVKGDSTNLDIQSFYGVLDRDGEDTLGRGDLWTQSVVFEGAMGSQEVRVTSGNPPDWSAKRGWVMDLLPPDKAAHGERVIAPPLLRYGRVIFNTILPSADDPCHQGSGWLMELDAATGANLSYAALDINGDGEFTTDDAVAYTDALGNSVSSPAAGVKSGSMSLNQPTVVTAGNKEYKFTSNVDGGIGSVTEKTSSTMGRTSWRQLQ